MAKGTHGKRLAKNGPKKVTDIRNVNDKKKEKRAIRGMPY